MRDGWGFLRARRVVSRRVTAKTGTEERAVGYEEALRLIEKKAAELANWKDIWSRDHIDLDLSGQELTELPSELFHLTAIAELDLSRNCLTELPSALFQLTNLRRLYLYYTFSPK